MDSKQVHVDAKTPKGAEIHHSKSQFAEKEFAVWVIICRPLVRKLLVKNVDVLLEELGKLAKPLGPRESGAFACNQIGESSAWCGES